MRKLPSSLENPIDDLFIEVADKMSPALKATGHTPNMITTYSLGSAALSLLALHNGQVGVFSGLWILRSFWDCVDGHFARKYDMVTRLGDAYDHLTDMFSVLGLVAIAYRRYVVPSWMLVFFSGALVLNLVQLGCQQRFAGARAKESLDTLQPLCPDAGWLRWLKWGGHGTVQVLIVFAIMFLEKHHKREGVR